MKDFSNINYHELTMNYS